jgi:HSP20 family protein
MVFRYENPRQAIDHLREEMNRLFTGLTPDGAWPWVSGRGQPAVNVWETDDAVVAELEVPGVKGDQIDVAVVGNELTLKIQRPDNQPEEVTFHRRERPSGPLTRVLRLPVPVDADRVTAELREGVLTVTLPKAESAMPRKIDVKTA